jgi:hypothetical protein
MGIDGLLCCISAPELPAIITEVVVLDLVLLSLALRRSCFRFLCYSLIYNPGQKGAGRSDKQPTAEGEGTRGASQ